MLKQPEVGGNQLNFGGLGGVPYPIPPSGSQPVYFYVNTLTPSPPTICQYITGIQIGGTKYGNYPGGDQRLANSVILNPDGSFVLKKLQTISNGQPGCPWTLICYVEGIFGNTATSFGTLYQGGYQESRENVTFLDLGDGIKVTFAVISCGGSIDSLTFNKLQ